MDHPGDNSRENKKRKFITKEEEENEAEYNGVESRMETDSTYLLRNDERPFEMDDGNNSSDVPHGRWEEPESPTTSLPLNVAFQISELGGLFIQLVIKKKIFKTDLSTNHGRFSIPTLKVKSDFLTEEEKEWLNGNDIRSEESKKVETWVIGEGGKPLSPASKTIIDMVDVAYDCYDDSGDVVAKVDQTLNLKGGPFRFSDTQNKLTGFGCDTVALMVDSDGNVLSDCITVCAETDNITNGNFCSGIGCCHSNIPKSLKTLNVTSVSLSSHSGVSDFNPCGRSFLADQRTFDVSKLNLSGGPNVTVKSDVAIEWVVKEEQCEQLSDATKIGCGDNSACFYSKNGNGSRCSCKQGYEGNPYLGCQDIDECKHPLKFKCEGTCKNTLGSYRCKCPFGMDGDGKFGCRGFRITTIASVVGASIFTVIISFLTFIVWKRRTKEINFIQNGGMLLKHQRVKIFTEKELIKATNNYDETNFLGEGGFGSVYKGVLVNNTQVAVKKPKGMDKNLMNEDFLHEIGIISQVNHKNVVKIMGLCLHTQVPLLVYEFISNGTLYQHIHKNKSQVLRSWRNRLRIAAEIASAIDYLHSLADPPIIHRDIKSANILLDENYTAKVADFGASVLISPDQNCIATKVQGTFGYLDPEYLMTGNLTEKSDVYSFGVVLVELLTGEKPISKVRSEEKRNIVQYFISSMEEKNLPKIIGFEVADEDEMKEIEDIAELAKQCLHSNGLKRPRMRKVAEKLGKFNQLYEKLWSDQQQSEESDHLLFDLSYDFPMLYIY